MKEHAHPSSTARPLFPRSHGANFGPAAGEHVLGAQQLCALQFERRGLTLLHAESRLLCRTAGDDRRFDEELEWLAEFHHGEIGHNTAGSAFVSFQTPLSALRMAVHLQRVAAAMRLRIGLISSRGPTAVPLASQETGVVVGNEPARAALAARSAAAGSILISPETYRDLAGVFAGEVFGCVVTEEYCDAELAHASVTPAPHSSAEMSSFAGLGLI